MSDRADAWRVLCDELASTVERLRRDGADLLDRAAIPVSEGYSSRASGSGDGRGGTTEADGVSRPVESIALRAVDDPLHRHTETMRTAVRTARDALRAADKARSAANRPPEPDVDDAPAGPRWCVNCARYELEAPAVKASRCTECFEYRRDHHNRDAPLTVILERPQHAAQRAAGAAALVRKLQSRAS